MDVRETRGVGNNGISDKRLVGRVSRQRRVKVRRRMARMRLWRRAESIARLDTRSPAPHENLFDTPPALAYFATLQRIKTRHQTRVLDHERHELGGVATNVEELEAIVLDKLLKGSVGGDADAVAVGIAEGLAEGDKGLDVAAGADDLDDNVELRRRRLAGEAAEAGRDVRGR